MNDELSAPSTDAAPLDEDPGLGAWPSPAEIAALQAEVEAQLRDEQDASQDARDAMPEPVTPETLTDAQRYGPVPDHVREAWERILHDTRRKPTRREMQQAL